jgi:hypothetical protein
MFHLSRHYINHVWLFAAAALLILLSAVLVLAQQIYDVPVGIGMAPSSRGEWLRVRGQAIFGDYGRVSGAITLMPPDGTGFYHIDNPGGQRIRISGGDAPGRFEYMNIAHPGRVTILGDLYVTGRKSFIHSHPTDPTKEIIYVCPEGPEAGTYIRGTAQLNDGVAVISLPEHFSLVTSSENLTVQVTCLDECNGLRVAEKSPKQILVKELLGGKSKAKFDYLVQGIRRGHADPEIIRDK